MTFEIARKGQITWFADFFTDEGRRISLSRHEIIQRLDLLSKQGLSDSNDYLELAKGKKAIEEKL